jgi:hypothetical protein
MKTCLYSFAIVILCMLTACLETGSDDDNNKPAQSCKLVSSSTTITNNQGASHSYDLWYSYNNDGQLQAIQGQDTSSFNIELRYDSQKRLINEKMGSHTWRSEYNNEGQLEKQVLTFEFAPGRFETYYFLHKYNSAGLLQQSEYFADEETTDILLYTYKYSYQSERIAGIEKISEQDARYNAATILFDDKKLPLPALAMHLFYTVRDEALPVTGILPANIINYNVQQGEVSSGFRSFTASYSYNHEGYPLTVNRTYADGGKEVTNYTYNCL